MSIERLERQGGVVWRVRWREGGHNRAKVLGRKRDAEAFDADIRRRKRAGELVESAGAQMTLTELAHEWLQVYGAPNLARSTLESYAITWDRHVLPHIGGLRLRELTPQLLERYRGELAAAGVGLPTQASRAGDRAGHPPTRRRVGIHPNQPGKGRAQARRPPPSRRAADGARSRRTGTSPTARGWRSAQRDARVRARLRGRPTGRGARADLRRRAPAHDPGRAIRLARRDQGDQDRATALGAPPPPARRRPEPVASCVRRAGRRGRSSSRLPAGGRGRSMRGGTGRATTSGRRRLQPASRGRGRTTYDTASARCCSTRATRSSRSPAKQATPRR